MQKDFWARCAASLAAVAMVLASVGVASGAAAPQDVPTLHPHHQSEWLAGPVEPLKLSDYWIGVGCQPVRDATLRAQLNLPEDQGLQVAQVVVDSPAAKAGIQQHDILLKANGKPLGSMQDLADAVDAVKDKELKLELLRGGKSSAIKVKPAKRPEEPAPEFHPKAPDPRGHAPDAFRKWLEDVRPWEDGNRPWGFRFWGPGTILPHGPKGHPPMPGNLSVTITKSGDEPAKIVVKRDGKKWEVTEDELDKLPPDVRPHVDRMRGRAAFPWGNRIRSFDFNVDPRMYLEDLDRKILPERGLEKQLDDMNRRIDELRKSMEDLRKNRPRLRPPKPKPDPPKEKQEQV